jgi:hypothetical protein
MHLKVRPYCRVCQLAGTELHRDASRSGWRCRGCLNLDTPGEVSRSENDASGFIRSQGIANSVRCSSHREPRRRALRGTLLSGAHPSLHISSLTT